MPPTGGYGGTSGGYGGGGTSGYGGTSGGYDSWGSYQGPASYDAGQTAAMALYGLQGVYSINQLTDSYQQTTTTSTQSSATQSAQIMDGISKYEDLRLGPTGTFHYAFTGALGAFVQTMKFGSPVSIPGTVDMRLTIDFGARSIGGGGSFLNINSTMSSGNINFNYALPVKSFDTLTGTATYQAASGSPITLSTTFNNVGGVIAHDMTMSGHYNNGSGSEGNIVSFTTDRQPGS